MIFFGDPGFLILSLLIAGMLGLASKNVERTFQKYHQVANRRRMTGAQVARQILDMNGLRDVAIERVQGKLTDHYDPRSRVLRLSQLVHDHPSVSAIGVAAHEAGHALQDKAGYFALKLRQGIYPLANFGSSFGMILIMIGLFTGMMSQGGNFTLAWIGVALYGCGVFFSIITLPVEFNASSRALAAITQNGIVTQDEYSGTRKVLNAAALTYVAAAAGAILQLLYLVMMLLGASEE